MDEENTLFPVEESPEFIDDGERLDRDYHYTVAWDVEKQDFVLNGKGQMDQCDGVEGYKVWCCKMALTQRYLFLDRKLFRQRFLEQPLRPFLLLYR